MKFVVAVKLIIKSLRLLPVYQNNYIEYIRQHYGTFAANTAYQYRRTQLKLVKTKLDIAFLKKCKNNNLLPNFVRFRVSPTFSRHQNAINNCYKQILTQEIRIKKRKLSQLYRHSNYFKSDLSHNIDELLYSRSITIVERFVNEHAINVSSTHEEKFRKLQSAQPASNDTMAQIPSKYPIQPVHNYSRRILTSDEINILSNGLDYVLAESKSVEETFICNIETCFYNHLGRTTETRDYERKSADEKVNYRLTTE